MRKTVGYDQQFSKKKISQWFCWWTFVNFPFPWPFYRFAVWVVSGVSRISFAWQLITREHLDKLQVELRSSNCCWWYLLIFLIYFVFDAHLVPLFIQRLTSIRVWMTAIIIYLLLLCSVELRSLGLPESPPACPSLSPIELGFWSFSFKAALLFLMLLPWWPSALWSASALQNVLSGSSSPECPICFSTHLRSISIFIFLLSSCVGACCLKSLWELPLAYTVFYKVVS